uniref:Uncharacterized protein n=1 Tax=viral metagenome TaxID=1070528 RepID=A0A6C0BNY0_9ZZZZ
MEIYITLIYLERVTDMYERANLWKLSMKHVYASNISQ